MGSSFFAPLGPTAVEKARLLPRHHIDLFKAIVEGTRPLYQLEDWFEMNADVLERTIGRTLFLRLKFDRLDTVRFILDVWGVTCAAPPVFLPIAAVEYAVDSALIDHRTRNNGPSGTVNVYFKTGRLGRKVREIREAETVKVLGTAALNDLYLKNFREYDLAPEFAPRLGFRLESDETCRREPRASRYYPCRVGFDEGGRRALAVLRWTFGGVIEDYVAVLYAKPSGVITRSDGWELVADTLASSIHFSSR